MDTNQVKMGLSPHFDISVNEAGDLTEGTCQNAPPFRQNPWIRTEALRKDHIEIRLLAVLLDPCIRHLL